VVVVVAGGARLRRPERQRGVWQERVFDPVRGSGVRVGVVWWCSREGREGCRKVVVVVVEGVKSEGRCAGHREEGGRGSGMGSAVQGRLGKVQEDGKMRYGVVWWV